MVFIRGFCLSHRQPQMIQAKLLKADLHGAIVSGNLLRSSSSGCPSHHSAATPYHADIPPLPALRVGDDCRCNQFSPLVGHFKWPLCTFSTQRSQLASQRAQHHPQPGTLNWSPWFYMSAMEWQFPSCHLSSTELTLELLESRCPLDVATQMYSKHCELSLSKTEAPHLSPSPGLCHLGYC